MRTIAFVGPSGTGKSHRSIMVARKYDADAVIDDGLLISGTKLLAGVSAKKEPTKIASVRRALFTSQEHVREVQRALRENHIECVMILGTSDAMVHRIAEALALPPIDKIIRIQDVATPEEMAKAQNMRLNEGKHVIPVPTFEIKKEFSGYFLHPLRIFQKNLSGGRKTPDADKSIVRPTFSYMGNYEISDNVVAEIAAHEAKQVEGIDRVISVNIRKTEHGAHIDMSVVMEWGYPLQEVARRVQMAVACGVEQYTSVNARRVHVYIRSIKK